MWLNVFGEIVVKELGCSGCQKVLHAMLRGENRLLLHECFVYGFGYLVLSIHHGNECPGLCCIFFFGNCLCCIFFG